MRGRMQFVALLRKHTTQMMRSWRTTLMLLLCPILCLATVVCVRAITLNLETGETGEEDPHPGEVLISGLPACHTVMVGARCVALAIVPDVCSRPDNSSWGSVIDNIAAHNGLRVGQDIVGFEDVKLLREHILASPNTTMAALELIEDALPRFHYVVWYNSTASEMAANPDEMWMRLAVQSEVNRAIMAVSGWDDGWGEVRISSKALPSMPRPDDSQYAGVHATLVLMGLVNAMVMVLAVLMLIAHEREAGMRELMYVQGMTNWAYWMSWGAMITMLTVATTVLWVAAGLAFGLSFFRRCAPGVLLVVFFLFFQAMVAGALALATVIPTTVVAVGTGIGLMFFSFSVEEILTSLSIYDLWNPHPSAMLYLLMLFPPFHFAKCVADISFRTSSVWNGMRFSRPHYSWADLSSTPDIGPHVSTSVWPTEYSLWSLLGCILVFLFLAWVLDVWSLHRNALFCCRLDYYASAAPQSIAEAKVLAMFERSEEDREDESEDDNNSQEGELRQLLYLHGTSSRARRFPLKILRLSKHYGATRALHDVTFGVEEGSVVCVLGKNGAGKSTLFRCLTGRTRPSHGDAEVYGHSVTTDGAYIRRFVGMCPQRDCLWPELTAREHLMLYAAIRGVPGRTRREVVDAQLEESGLDEVADQISRTLSGGMQRRLSVAMAFVGNPSVVFLDEPSNGLDVYARRQLWTMIKRRKRGRLVVMSTHSMEEADFIGDKIAMLVNGRLRCVGTSTHLKNKYGTGYKFTFVARSVESITRVEALVEECLPEAAVFDRRGNTIVYSVDQGVDGSRSAALFDRVESRTDIIADWSVEHATLDEVFVRLNSRFFGNQSPTPTPAMPQ